MLRSMKAAIAAAVIAVFSAAPAAAVIDFDDFVVIDKDDVGLNFVVDYTGKANGSETTQLSALGNFTYTGVTNNGLTYNFNYSLMNDSNYASRIRSFGFDTTGDPTALASSSPFTWEYENASFIEGVGTMDVCFAAGSDGCTAHGSGGLTKGQTGTGTFALTFAQTMESLTFDHFAMKFVSVNPTINGQDWGAGLGHLVSMTPGAGANPSQPIVAPEPGTWLMMLGGFGMVGFAMRRRETRVLRPQIA